MDDVLLYFRVGYLTNYCQRVHHMVHPETFPVSDDVKRFYPAFKSIEDKMWDIPIHLQIFDGKMFTDQWQMFLHEVFIYTCTDAALILPIYSPLKHLQSFVFVLSHCS